MRLFYNAGEFRSLVIDCFLSVTWPMGFYLIFTTFIVGFDGARRDSDEPAFKIHELKTQYLFTTLEADPCKNVGLHTHMQSDRRHRCVTPAFR